MQKPNASAKKIAFFIFLFTLMILLIVPFFLDYSKFKPQFQTMIAKSFNANLDFDSARLQLLPKFGVSIRNLKIENTDPVFDRVTFLKVEKVLITTNLLSLLQGQIRGSAIIETPQIHVLKKGSLTNLAALPKATATNSDNHAKSASSNPDIKPDSSLPTPNSSQPATDRAISHTKETIELESIEIRGAMISYRDENQTQEENSKNTEHSNSTFDAKNLNVFISNLGFNRPIEIKANALMDYINGDIQINGPIHSNSSLVVSMNQDILSSANFSTSINFDSVTFNVKDAIVKKPGVVASAAIKGQLVPDDLVIESFMFVLQNLRLEGNAHVVDFKNPRVSSKFELISNNIASLGQVFPKHADMLSNGQFSLNAQVEGHVNQLDSFASQLEVEAKLVGANFGIRLVTTSIQPLRGSLNMTGEEVDIDRIVNPFIDSKYLQPSTASLNSQTNNVSSQSLNPASPQSNLNANEAVSPPPHQDSKSESSNIEKSHSDSAAKIDQPDFTLTSSQRRLLADSKFDVSTNVAKLIFKGAIFENLKFYLKQNDFKTSIQHLDSLGFGGAIMSKSSIDFMPTPLKFSSNLSLKGIHPELLTAFFAAEQKDLITGIVNFNLDIEGRGTSKSSLKKTLGGKGAFKFTEGSLRIPGIKSQMTDQLDSAIAKLTIDKDSSSVVSIAKKLLDSPLVKMTGKKPPDLDRIVDSVQSAAKVRISNTVGESRSLDGLNGNLEIKDGKVFFPMSQNDPLGEFNTKTYLDFDLNLGGTGTFLASNKAKTDMLEQSQYAKLLFDEHESFLLNLKFSGTAKDPKVTIDSENLRNNFQKNAKSALEKAIKEASDGFLKELLGEKSQVPGDAPQKDKKPTAKDIIKGLLGK